MRMARIMFSFYINSSIHVALAVVALSLVTMMRFELRPDIGLLFFIFFGSITAYNFVKYAGIAGLHHSSLARGLKLIQIFSLLSFIFLIISVFFVPFEVLIWSAFFGILTLLYALPLFSRGRNLRNIWGIKIFIIAAVWAGVTVVLPLAEHYGNPDLLLLSEFSQRFLLVVVWILPFEIRDLKYDLIQLGTVPQRIGTTKTRIFGILLLLLVILLELLEVRPKAHHLWSTICVCLLSAGFILKSKEQQSAYFASFWVEAIPFFWLLFLIFFSWI